MYGKSQVTTENIASKQEKTPKSITAHLMEVPDNYLLHSTCKLT